MLPLKPLYNRLHFIDLLLSPNVCTFSNMQPFLHLHTIFSTLLNLNFLTWRNPKFKVPKILPGALSWTQIEPNEPKRSKNDPYLDHETGVHRCTLPVGALIWVALIWVTFSSKPKSRNPPQITQKRRPAIPTFKRKHFCWIFNTFHFFQAVCAAKTQHHPQQLSWFHCNNILPKQPGQNFWICGPRWCKCEKKLKALFVRCPFWEQHLVARRNLFFIHATSAKTSSPILSCPPPLWTGLNGHLGWNPTVCKMKSPVCGQYYFSRAS